MRETGTFPVWNDASFLHETERGELRMWLAAPTTLVPATLLLLGGQVLPVISLLGPRPATWTGLAVAGLGIAAAYYPRWQARCRFRQSGLGMWLHPIDIILLLSIQWYA